MVGYGGIWGDMGGYGAHSPQTRTKTSFYNNGFTWIYMDLVAHTLPPLKCTLHVGSVRMC